MIMTKSYPAFASDDEELFSDFIVVAVVDDADGDSGAPDEEGFARAVFLDDG